MVHIDDRKHTGANRTTDSILHQSKGKDMQVERGIVQGLVCLTVGDGLRGKARTKFSKPYMAKS